MLPKLEVGERERRLKIVEKGIKEDFWKVLSQHISYVNLMRMQEVIDLHAENRPDEAKILALQIKAKQEILAEPRKILLENKSFMDKVKEKLGMEKIS